MSAPRLTDSQARVVWRVLEWCEHHVRRWHIVLDVVSFDGGGPLAPMSLVGYLIDRDWLEIADGSWTFQITPAGRAALAAWREGRG